MKITIIIMTIVIILLIIMFKIKYMDISDNNITMVDNYSEPETISNHFIKMFRDVSPWPGISQASYKPKTENVIQP